MSDRKKNCSSSLRHRLTLQQEQQADDGQGGYTRSWQDIVDIWAEIDPASNGGWMGNAERLADGQIQERIMHKIRIRYRSGINAGMRLTFNERIFNIRTVTNVNEASEILEILAEEGVAG